MRAFLILMTMTVFLAPQANAATAFFNATISRVIVSNDDEFGGCMVRPNVSMEDSLDCRTWATMDCAGVLGGSKAEGQRKFDTAQLANVLKKRIGLTITDDKKINGYCYVERVAFTN